MSTDCLERLFGFLSDFSANFLSDLIVGAAFGTILAWWVGRRLNALDRSQQRKEDRKRELKKAVHYLEILKGEVETQTQEIPDYVESFQGESFRVFAMLPTIWTMLQPGGELPRLLDPDLLVALSSFYGYLENSQRANDLFASILLSESRDSKAMKERLRLPKELVVQGLERAVEAGEALPARIECETQRLKTQISTL